MCDSPTRLDFTATRIINVFPYRDYVIDAFNHDKPFDQFTIEQLAGDLLPHPTTEQLIATAFNRLNMVTREGRRAAEGIQRQIHRRPRPDDRRRRFWDRRSTAASATITSTIRSRRTTSIRWARFSRT